ncbi:5142_t:CDS:2, partial [Dentiscutata heterogama]
MPKDKQKKRFTYVEPTPEEVTSLQKKSVVENTHRSTLNWTSQFEKYRKDTNLPGELFDISNPKQLEEELCKYFTMCHKANGDDYSVTSLQSAINAFNRYFNGETSKLKPIDLNNKKAHPDLWPHLGENSMKAFFKRLVMSCDIDISGRKITNQTGHKTLIQTLKALGLSNYETMSISRHKSQKELASYECPIKHVQELGYQALDKAINYETNSSTAPNTHKLSGFVSASSLYQEFKSDNPTIKNFKSDDPMIKNFKSDDSRIENFKSDDPTIENFKSNDPTIENFKSDDLTIENFKSDDPTIENFKSDNPMIKNFKSDDPTIENFKSDNPMIENFKSRELLELLVP